MESMKLVVVESPYAGDVETNVRYARAAIRDCLMRGEAPFASHLCILKKVFLTITSLWNVNTASMQGLLGVK